ncbi:hypothetical protein HGP16_15150 [Rhizobium sp. P40RR-XXII]|uniref:hypothetical protein n=1 Tax=unclassified Rhizobium TaxID=2613769 RepID=UPI00145669A8|nr:MULTISPECIES: hypothetical protein [unclassified Rhizobium]NLR87080.1 hypothetical protein [Rhizobium sp. P28RR-XV]NLS17899.1 hypothetical protein [Rhizobium sp. P40RR-XXII]
MSAKVIMSSDSGMPRSWMKVEAVLDTIFAIVQQRQILLAEADRFHPTPARRADPLFQGEGEEP